MYRIDASEWSIRLVPASLGRMDAYQRARIDAQLDPDDPRAARQAAAAKSRIGERPAIEIQSDIITDRGHPMFPPLFKLRITARAGSSESGAALSIATEREAHKRGRELKRRPILLSETHDQRWDYQSLCSEYDLTLLA